MKHLRRIVSLLLALLTACSVCRLPAARADESDYFFGENVYGILNTGERALADGMDPEWVLSEMRRGAEEMECEEAFNSICGNIAAYGGKDYQKIAKLLGDGEPLRGLGIDNPASDRIGRDGWSVYDRPEVSDEMAKLLQDPKAEYCFEAGWWMESEFQSVFGTSYQKFRPSRPRPGYVCVIVRKGAQLAPETPWNAEDADEYRWDSPLYRAVSSLVWTLDEDAPVLTGNPHLASAFWVFDLTYPFHAYYGSEEKIKGYNCKTSLTVETADGKKKIAQISASGELGSTIYSSSVNDGIAKADTPDFSELDTYEKFRGDVLLALNKERAAAIASQKVTQRNIQNTLNSFLISQAENTSDPWEKAIYESGASNIYWDGGTVTFSLRSFDPGLDEMSSYANREDSYGWLSSALSNTAYRQLDLTLKVVTGVFTHSSQTSMKKTVSAAAAKAKAAFESKDMKQAVKDWLFLSPIAGKAQSADQLIHPETSFCFWASDLAEELPGSVPDGALAALFYAQKSQKLITADGPKNLSLECVGADPAALLSAASSAALDRLAYAPAESRYDGSLEDLLLETLAQTAMAEKDRVNHHLTIPLSFTQSNYFDLPSGYREYMKAFDFSDVLSGLEDSAERLPEMAAISMPRNGKMTGGSSGSEMTLQLSKSSSPTYVQCRRESDNRLVASAFVHPGKTVTVYLPSGSYRIYACNGPYWYGEYEMFGDNGYYHKSEPVKIDSRHTYTYTLEAVKDGNTTTYQANRDEFRQK